MKKILIIIACGLCINAQAQQSQKSLIAYRYSIDDKNYCKVINGSPNAEAAFFSEKWGGKQIKTTALDANGVLEVSDRNFHPAFVLDKGTNYVSFINAEEFSIKEMNVDEIAGQKTISWKATADMNKDISFVVMKSKNGKKWETVDAVTATKTPVELKYSVTDANSNANLYQIIVVNNNEGERYTSPAMSVSNIAVSVYPTIVDNRLTIALRTEVANANYTITNISGQLVKSGTLNTGKNEIDVAGLSGGSYMVNVSGKDIQLTEKIVKQ